MNKIYKLSYNETSLIVNALEYYRSFCEMSESESLKKTFNEQIDIVKEKLFNVPYSIFLLNLLEKCVILHK